LPEDGKGKDSHTTMNRQERRAAKAGKGGAPPVGEVLGQALRLHQAGQLVEAETLYRQVLAREPAQVDAMQLLGLVAHQRGRHDVAIDLIGRAIGLKDDAPHFHANLSQVLRAAGKREEAEVSYRRALALKPDYLDAWLGLAIVLQEMGRAGDAEVSYRQVLALKPDLAEAHNNLGNVLEELGRLGEAAQSYERAAAMRPGDVGMLHNWAAALLAGGEAAKALTVVRQAFRISETAELKTLLGRALKEVRDVPQDEALRSLVARALAEAWGRPQDLASIATRLLKNDDLSARRGDPLMLALLENVIVADREIETQLTDVRKDFLSSSLPRKRESMEPPLDSRFRGNDDLNFICALARQCFINEYVWQCDEAERSDAGQLRADIIAALDGSQEIDPLSIASLASYFPLHTLPNAERLLARPWQAPIEALLTQQVREPVEECALQASIFALTPIADRTSLAVQQQYEENPYPRWVKTMPASGALTFDGFIAKQLPLAPYRPLGKGGAIDMLIAGSGTGQHVIETARLFPDAKMLAIDLSRASLAYAKRQGDALGLTAIEYAQADILELGSVERRFDVIESSGVLHHLADPMAGWRVLLSLLRPGGVMWLGFYSAVARQDVIAARDFIAQNGFGDSADDICHARQAMIAAGEDAPFAAITRVADFYSTSACRDLLFHVQEHRLTLPVISEFIAANDLTFLGFDLELRTAALYRDRFPTDRAMSDLADWHQFETEHPLTFRNMYQFWVQKAL
jgi:tetratricopeptide (TPR) repeat protein/SAM-dependent methyltransferase